MKLTRRSVIQMLGLGAAAAALAPVKAAEAANQIQVQPLSRGRTPGDTDLARCCVTCRWVTPWSNAKPTMEGVIKEASLIVQHNADVHGGEVQEVYGVWRPHTEDPIEVPWHMLATNLNTDAMRVSVEMQRGHWPVRTWFASTNPKTGERVVLRAKFPGESA